MSTQELSPALNNGRPAPAPIPPKASVFAGIETKWLVAIAVVFGVFMAVLDVTVVNIALAKLQAVFGVSLDSIQWVVTGYTLAQTVSIPLFGYLADRYGAKWIYLASLAMFTVASMLCGLSWSNNSMIAFRILQGLGGGALLPLAIAQIFAVFPPAERGRATAAIGIPVLLAPAIGPTLGGYLVQNADWRLIFYLNVPIGVIGFIMGAFILPRSQPNARARLDIVGLALSMAGFASLVYGVGEAASDGWGSPTVIGFSVFGALCLLALVVVELRSADPLLDMRLFKDWNFASGNLITWATRFALFGALFLMPLFLQSLRGLNPQQAGLVLLPSSLVTIVVLPFSGIFVDRVGAKWSIVVGLTVLTFTSYLLAHITLATPIRLLQLWLIGRSIGLGFAAQPAQVIALSNIPRAKLSRASSFYNVMAQVASAFTTSFLATYVKGRTAPHFAHLADMTTPSSPTALFINQLIAGAQARGLTALQARAQVLQLVVGQMRRQASVLAFRDALLLIAALTACGALLALLVGSPSKRAGEPAMIME
jgi:DHA2 family multidrug resistance protein